MNIELSANLLLITANILVSLSAFNNGELFHKLKFNAYYITRYREYYRLVTSGFVHADFIHLFFNMFVLFMFGRYAEYFFQDLTGNRLTGSLAYALFYLGAIPMSSLYSLEKHKHDDWYNAVGASGAVSAVLFCFILQQPFSSMLIFPIPFPVPAIIFGVAYLVYSWYMGQRGGDNIGHDAHLFGAIFGVMITLLSKPGLAIQLFNQITS
jgi:membrane associated rhomboid family serine protease